MPNQNAVAVENVTFLGPAGATFSNMAYDILATMYGAPPVHTGSAGNYVPATVNDHILEKVLEHGGYGAIATETLAECRVRESIESFVELAKSYGSSEKCPIQVHGALQLTLNFALMARVGVCVSPGMKLVAHPKAIGACKGRIDSLQLQPEQTSSNGEAARLVAEDPAYAEACALGPISAAKKYGLQIIEKAFEDHVAVTTFFLVGPRSRPVVTGKKNRVLIVFTLNDRPGALGHALIGFSAARLNMIQIHSMQCGNRQYLFIIELEVSDKELSLYEEILAMFAYEVKSHICFGPFEVRSQ